MCGIFGLALGSGSSYGDAFVKKCATQLAMLAVARGKDSSGFAFRDHVEARIDIHKGDIPIGLLLKEECVRSRIDALTKSYRETPGQPFTVVGHSRLVTNGSQLRNENNQPVVKDGVVGLLNGIIVNDEALWARHPEIRRAFDVDTEVMLALVRQHLKSGWDVEAAISKTLAEVVGMVASAYLFDDLDLLALATNNGSLYVLTNDSDFLAFASEEHFLRVLAKRMGLQEAKGFTLRQIAPNTGVVLDLVQFGLRTFATSDEPRRLPQGAVRKTRCEVGVLPFARQHEKRELILDPATIARAPMAAAEEALLEYNVGRIGDLRRCARCVLPETFPFIDFDEDGVCNYCRDYKIKNDPKSVDELFDLVKPYRRSDGKPDCLVPYSGGRDSTFTLHFVKKVLELHPIAFTYDWGMVNDLARRNTSRVCGKLGVEHIFRAADLWWKRENVRKNVVAWLHKPNLAMVPVFMAGDKYFYYYTDQIKRQTGLRLNIWGINPLENTDFKVGFLGVPPDPEKKRIYSLSAPRQARLLTTAARIMAGNPRYLNRSLLNTAGGFVWRSILPHRDYVHLFDYYRWDEREIEALLREYDWETAIDTKSTWRIGDATAPFYNYIYCTIAGFSEHDTFRSNQIREGALTREEAMALLVEENRPRYPSIKWYTSILDLDYTRVVKTINAVPKLYP
jgi:glucosamine--fructose-6-phosphate aminotransferase (isomerizing)